MVPMVITLLVANEIYTKEMANKKPLILSDLIFD